MAGIGVARVRVCPSCGGVSLTFSDRVPSQWASRAAAAAEASLSPDTSLATCRNRYERKPPAVCLACVGSYARRPAALAGHARTMRARRWHEAARWALLIGYAGASSMSYRYEPAPPPNPPGTLAQTVRACNTPSQPPLSSTYKPPGAPRADVPTLCSPRDMPGTR